MLVTFSVSIVLRIIFNVAYLCHTVLDLCVLQMDDPRWFAVLQSSLYLFGEVLPIMSLFALSALELCRGKKQEEQRLVAESAQVANQTSERQASQEKFEAVRLLL